MRASILRAGLLIPGVGLAAACLGEGGEPVGPAPVDVAVAPQPAVIPSAADASALPINRIRAVATAAGNGAVLGETVVDVSPTAASWEIRMSLPSAGYHSDLVLFVYLIHVADDGTASVEFSGRTDPFPLLLDEETSPSVPIVRGPLANLFTTSVTITSAPASMPIDGVATLAATATTTGSDPPTIFWTSLDPTIVMLDGSAATALAAGTARIVASAGTFGDTVQITVGSTGQPALLGSFQPGLGILVSVALDPATSNLFLHSDFAAEILEYTQAGTLVTPGIPRPGLSSNDIDLDFLSVATTVGSTVAPGGSLLVVNGETNPGFLYAIDKDDGAVLDSIVMPSGTGNSVGGAYHAARGTLFSIDWTSDVLSEIDLATAEVVSTFTVAPVGAPAYDVFFGDVDVDPASGNLILVSSSQNVVRILTPTGVWVRDIDLASLDVAGLSGVAWDEATRTAWMVSTNGMVYHVGGLD